VADAAAMLSAIAGADPRDPTASRLPVPDYVRALDQGMTGVRLGVDERYLTVGVHPDVSQAVLAAVDVLKAQGAEMVAVTVPELAHDATERAWYTITAAEALVAHAGFYPERAADYGPFREVLEDGTKASAQAYAQAHQVREELSGRLQELFENVDVVLCPTMPSTAPRMDAQGNARMAEGLVRTRYTFPWNFSRHPTLSLPCGFDSEGMPVSLQLVARHFAEEVLCRVGSAYEQATSWHTVRPPLLTD
jgi:amidase